VKTMPEGLSYYGTQLNLNSEITLRLLFTVAEGKEASSYGNFSANNTSLGQLKQAGTYYCVDIEGIGADALGTGYTIKCGNQEIITNCSVLTYARAVVNAYSGKEDATDRQKNLLNVSKALYLYNQKAVTYVANPATDVKDIFYNGEGFYAEPDCINKVYLTTNNEATTVATDNTEITSLSQLNGSRTKGYSVWMKEAYDVSEESITGPYVIRRYTDNEGNVLNVTGTATVQAKIDGSCGTYVAQHLGNKTSFTIDLSEDSVAAGTSLVQVGTGATFTIGEGGIIQNSHVENGEVYVSGTPVEFNITGKAKSGVITVADEVTGVTINVEGLTVTGEEEQVVLASHAGQSLTGNGDASAITLIDDGDEHFGVVKHENNVRIASVICVCGDDVTGKTSHDNCPWAGENGIAAVYNIPWQAHTATTGTMPGYNQAGYYYLTNALKLTSQSDITVTSHLDLNGKTITLNDTSRNIVLKKAGIEYSVADSKGGGTIKASENYAYTAGYGGVVWYYEAATATFSMYGGTIDMTNILKAPTAPNNAGDEYHLIDISVGGRFAVYGGEIKSAQNGDCIGSRGNGKINVLGGTIYGKVILRNATDSITVGGDAKVGIPLTNVSTGYGISAWTENTQVIGVNVTSNAQIVFASGANISLSATGAKEAFVVPVDYEIYDNNGQWSMRIDTTDHTEETIPGKAATCTETGLTDGTKCSVCDKILVAQEVIPALGHDFYDVTEEDLRTMKQVGDKVIVGEDIVVELTAVGNENNTYKIYCLRCIDAFKVVELDFIDEEDGKQFENDNEANYNDAWSVVEDEKELTTFDTSKHDTSLTQLGQDIYSTGANFLATSSMTIDGTIDADEGWVCVTPNGVTKTLADSYMRSGSNSSYDLEHRMTPVTSGKGWDNADYMPDLKYYVAQSEDSSDEYIHVAFEVIYPSVEIGGLIGYFRLGFNPNDYTQQLMLYADSPSTAIITEGMADNSTVTKVSTTNATTAFTQDVLVLSSAKNGVYEITLSKTQLKAAYLAVFNTTLTDADLNTMFVGVSLRVRLDNADKARPYYGTLLTASAASSAGENTVIPDVIVFGEEKDTDSSAYSSCSFTGHSIEDRYLVAGTTDTYYHACTHCGMAGAKTFKMDGDTIVCE